MLKNYDGEEKKNKKIQNSLIALRRHTSWCPVNYIQTILMKVTNILMFFINIKIFEGGFSYSA